MSVPHEAWNLRSRSSFSTHLSIALLALSLIAGVALRTVRLDQVPPGLHHDEACNGYDAYSILLTGRDHHGNFLPIVVQGFNDYRMPLFDYSLIPLVAAFGLKPVAVRLGAALWGSIDLAAVAVIAASTLGLPGAAMAVLLVALSPWHLALSRYGIETTAASATVSVAMACFFLWLRKGNGRWLVLSGVFFGISLYSYAMTRAFTILMILLLSFSYKRELSRARKEALGTLGIFLLFAIPQVIRFLLYPAETLVPFKNLSLFEHVEAQGGSLLAFLGMFGASCLSYFTPAFLFLYGDRGDHWTLVHPPGFGQLLTEQAVLIALALSALLDQRRRKFALLLLGWLLCATLPAALTIPLGAQWPEPPAALPTPWILFNSSAPDQPISASLLLSHPDSRHAALAMVPWILLSALGFVVLLELTSKNRLLRATVVSLLVAAVIFSGGRFVKSYFWEYPTIAAPFFTYGMEKVVDAVQKYNHGQGPAVITYRPEMPYIFVLFFEHYNPMLFQRGPVYFGGGASPPPINLFAPVTGFDRYLFVDPNGAFSLFQHGIFVFAADETLPTRPALTIRYPDGNVAYYVVVK